MGFTGCKKNPVYKVDPALKATFSYQPGTYWIYKDSLSGRTDSFYVTNNLFTSTTADDITIDQIGIVICEKNIVPIVPPDLNDSSLWTVILENNQISVLWNYTKIELPEACVLANYPFSLGILPHSANTNVTNIFSSFSVGSNTYTNVEEANCYDSISPQVDHNNWFYLCSDVGIIKMRLNYPQVPINRIWELQRWHIVK